MPKDLENVLDITGKIQPTRIIDFNQSNLFKSGPSF